MHGCDNGYNTKCCCVLEGQFLGLDALTWIFDCDYECFKSPRMGWELCMKYTEVRTLAAATGSSPASVSMELERGGGEGEGRGGEVKQWEGAVVRRSGCQCVATGWGEVGEGAGLRRQPPRSADADGSALYAGCHGLLSVC
jgi:hypothetical protein